ncbi:hypothetical protein PC112_g3738 [Phytophthora cactorum]|nr:hypothetical protein PC112_g3738 [Phytophthora cactorum]
MWRLLCELGPSVVITVAELLLLPVVAAAMADGVVVLLLVLLTLTAAELQLVVLTLDRAKSLRLALATPAAAAPCRRLLRASVVFLAWLQSASVLGRLVWLGLLPCE